jgi:hypothetical protein
MSVIVRFSAPYQPQFSTLNSRRMRFASRLRPDRGQDIPIARSHIANMSEVRKRVDTLCNDGHSWRVVDDLAHDHPVTPAELDAVEAFLMPLVHALLADGSDTQPRKTISITSPTLTTTHKRRNELLPEEI